MHRRGKSEKVHEKTDMLGRIDTDLRSDGKASSLFFCSCCFLRLGQVLMFSIFWMMWRYQCPAAQPPKNGGGDSAWWVKSGQTTWRFFGQRLGTKPPRPTPNEMVV